MRQVTRPVKRAFETFANKPVPAVEGVRTPPPSRNNRVRTGQLSVKIPMATDRNAFPSGCISCRQLDARCRGRRTQSVCNETGSDMFTGNSSAAILRPSLPEQGQPPTPASARGRRPDITVAWCAPEVPERARRDDPSPGSCLVRRSGCTRHAWSHRRRVPRRPAPPWPMP